MSQQQTITVELDERSYPIVIGADLLGRDAANGGFDLAAYVVGDNCLIVSNDTVAPIYLEKLILNLGEKAVSTLSLPDGEAYKTLATLQLILDQLVAEGANRDTTVIALGGGVVGDISGFAAACYLRGVAFIQVPTTLLAQVDSSVGGKTGVNHPGGKNLIGAFHQPLAVLIDTATLQTLPQRELRAGLAEVIKYGAICDADFFTWLEENMPRLLQKDPATLAYAIRRSCELKAEVVADDEREAGRRAILNFGHTFGHAIENCLGYGEWLHGEAVAAGMVMAAELSALSSADLDRLRALLVAAGIPVKPPPIDVDRWLEAMGMDKKIAQNKLRFVLLKALGECYVTSNYDEDSLLQILSDKPK